MATRREGWNGMHWIRDIKRLAIYLRDDFRCWHCGLDLRTLEPGCGLRIELDHIIPHALGGSNHATNLITSCSKCNARRQGRCIEAFDGEERATEIRLQATQPLPMELAKQVMEQRKAA